ncbi:MAG: TIGR00730 family Rossman fold protein [Acidimicrobiia bacterium]
MARLPRRRTGDGALDRRLLELLDGRVVDPDDLDLLFEMLTTVVRMAGDDVDRLNLKITNSALKEMRQAFRVFKPYRHVPKITIFGSARTLPDDPLYVQTRDLAAALAARGWMVVTGAGPGIMQAGAEGAGPERTIGVNIRLPFEQEANPFIAGDSRLVSMKYFFTRKLMLMKESAGFVVLPGGFGTLDETFELLTLLQTGKASLAPLVLLEVPGGTYWRAWEHFLHEEVAARGLISEDDFDLYHLTDNVEDAVGEVLGFYRNYHSMRYVGSTLVVRLRAAPTADELGRLNEEFADICVAGGIEATGPLPAETAGNDHVELPRLALRFDRLNHGRLRAMIDRLNGLASAPDVGLPDTSATDAAGTAPDTTGPPAVPGLGRELDDLVAQVGGGEEGDAVAAVAELAQALASPDVDEAGLDLLTSELCGLVLSVESRRVRLALLEALADASPVVGLDAVVELLVDHGRELADDELAVLLGALGSMVDATGDGTGAAASVASVVRLVDPRPVLEELAASGRDGVAARAEEISRRLAALAGTGRRRPA